jgi:hypothetical protein
VSAWRYPLRCKCTYPPRCLTASCVLTLRRSDDEYITHTGYMDQPEGRTPILSGFYYISKLFRRQSSPFPLRVKKLYTDDKDVIVTGMILDKRRRDRRKPPIGVMLQMRINEVDDLFGQVMQLMDGCPQGLKLDLDLDSRSVGCVGLRTILENLGLIQRIQLVLR